MGHHVTDDVAAADGFFRLGLAVIAVSGQSHGGHIKVRRRGINHVIGEVPVTDQLSLCRTLDHNVHQSICVTPEALTIGPAGGSSNTEAAGVREQVTGSSELVLCRDMMRLVMHPQSDRLRPALHGGFFRPTVQGTHTGNRRLCVRMIIRFTELLSVDTIDQTDHMFLADNPVTDLGTGKGQADLTHQFLTVSDGTGGTVMFPNYIGKYYGFPTAGREHGQDVLITSGPGVVDLLFQIGLVWTEFHATAPVYQLFHHSVR